MFEVSKADENIAPLASPSNGTGSAKIKSALKVTVPSELEGIAYIQVKTIEMCNKPIISYLLL